MRDDLFGVERAPKSYTDFLVRIAGRNPFDEPNYRIVWAANRYETLGGEWTDWPEDASVQERGGLVTDEYGNMGQSEVKPLRVVTELRKVQKYPICDCEKPVEYGYCPECDGIWGWLMEKWYPAHKYGSKNSWYAFGATGFSDIPKLGPYPEQGDYEKVTMSMLHLPPFDNLLNVIQQINRNTMTRKEGTAEDRILRKSIAADQKIERDKEKKKQLMIEKIRDRMTPFRGSSLGSGRLREEAANRAGWKGHVGA